MNTHVQISVIGARGGHGATTIAAVLALFGQRCTPTTLVAREIDDAAALLGVAIESSAVCAAVTEQLALARTASAGLVVEDLGASNASLPQRVPGELRLGVLRGPCYLGVRTLASADAHLDALVLLTEAGRCLTKRDVEDVLGIPVVAVIPNTERVARTIDAGTLVMRATQLSEFIPLARYLEHSVLAAFTNVSATPSAP